MYLRKSNFVHLLSFGANRVLLIHAVSYLRLPVDGHVARVVEFFATPKSWPEDCAGLAAHVALDRGRLLSLVDVLREKGVLIGKTPAEEHAAISSALTPTYGRDPIELLDRYRRSLWEGSEPYWSVSATRSVDDFTGQKKRFDVLLFGECDIQMETDFLRREAAKRGIDLHLAATAPDDIRFAAERRHDAILIGALPARHQIVREQRSGIDPPHSPYIAQARSLLEKLRQCTSAPILLDNLPEPTVQPLGLAETGLDGHRTRVRMANVVLADLAASFAGVHVVDVAAALAAAGSEQMVDDGLVGYTHFGSPGWLLQRPQSEMAAVHGIFDASPLARELNGDPYLREGVMARAHVDALATVLGHDRKKCVIVDLDGILWPGVLAETGSPFAWHSTVSGVYSHIGVYFGLHEALLSLKKRGIVLACVSKNDEATVRDLWRYEPHYPLMRLLTPNDFVVRRINWHDKVENIRSIAEELGFALETFLFIDDHPIERDRVQQRLPEVEVWGENLFALRRRLLCDPRLQPPVITEEAAQRTELVKAQLSRQQFRAKTLDEKSYIESLEIKCRIEMAGADSKLDRVEELFRRTTQFNATNRKFAVEELNRLIADPHGRIYTVHVSDKFGDHGLVGAAVIEAGEIIGLVMSCRVLGLGIEHRLMNHVMNDMKRTGVMLSARIVESSRNAPVRNIYRDSGFVRDDDGLWRMNAETGPQCAAD